MLKILKGVANHPTWAELGDVLTDPAWLAVIIACVALLPQLVRLGIWSVKRWQTWRSTIPTQSAKDRAVYGKLLDQYEKYLSLLEDLIILRAQFERGPDEWTPELQQKFSETRDMVYGSLEEQGDREEDMGIFQKLDILEDRTIGLAEQLKRRGKLRERQAEIEAHRLFIGRPEASRGSSVEVVA